MGKNALLNIRRDVPDGGVISQQGAFPPCECCLPEEMKCALTRTKSLRRVHRSASVRTGKPLCGPKYRYRGEKNVLKGGTKKDTCLGQEIRELPFNQGLQGGVRLGWVGHKLLRR